MTDQTETFGHTTAIDPVCEMTVDLDQAVNKKTLAEKNPVLLTAKMCRYI